MVTVDYPCSGCNTAQITYVALPEDRCLMPQRSNVAYAGGHLCVACDAAVSRALASVRALMSPQIVKGDPIYVADAYSGDVIRRATRADVIAASKGKHGVFTTDQPRDAYLVHLSTEANGNSCTFALSDAEIAGAL